MRGVASGKSSIPVPLLIPVIQVVGGYPFYKSAIKALIHGGLGMDLLIVLATTIAYVYSVVVLILDTVQEAKYDLFFDSGPLLFTFISFGRLLEHIAKVSENEYIFS